MSIRSPAGFLRHALTTTWFTSSTKRITAGVLPGIVCQHQCRSTSKLLLNRNFRSLPACHSSLVHKLSSEPSHVGLACGRLNLLNIDPHTHHLTMSRNSHSGVSAEDIIFRQLLEYKSYTYTYLLADPETKEAVLIDPVIETVERDIRVVKELGLNLIYAANTHVHADHITGTGEIKKRLPSCKSMIAEASQAKADVHLKQGDLIKFGRFQLEARSTPGHTNGCMSFVWHEKGMVFTGDALLIRGCGRTDFQQGSSGTLYESVHKQIFSLPQHFKVFPAHDYTGQTMSSVGEELKNNTRLTKSKNDFIDLMAKLSLPYPKQIDKALPANMVCGIFDEPAAAATN